MSLKKKLAKAGVGDRKSRSTKRFYADGPLWKGPEVDGITQSLLNRFLVCRERFRLLVIEGLGPVDTFIHRIEYGNMWHLCKETYDTDNGKEPLYNNEGSRAKWEMALRDFCRELCQKYPTQQEQIDKWYNVCQRQFALYLGYWGKHRSIKYDSLSAERVFAVNYRLPSGRTVLLRGKMDSVRSIGKKPQTYMGEYKALSGMDLEDRIKSQLRFDKQTMMYLVALGELCIEHSWLQPCGVFYDVVRRPLSGGKGSIKQLKPTKKNPAGESKDDYYERVRVLIAEDPEHYFMQWKCEVSAEDLLRFQSTFLDPILEQLCDWWEWVKDGDPWRPGNKVHWRHPYGVYNILNEGGSHDLDEYLDTGNKVGLTQDATLFSELGNG